MKEETPHKIATNRSTFIGHAEPPIILFDGVCNLCNRWVNFVIDHDPRAIFRFAPQQSATGAALMAARGIRDRRQEAVILIDGERTLRDSSAMIEICGRLEGGWRHLHWLGTIPEPIRDWTYRFVASHRYGWFGKSEACRIPTSELCERFLE